LDSHSGAAGWERAVHLIIVVVLASDSDGFCSPWPTSVQGRKSTADLLETTNYDYFAMYGRRLYTLARQQEIRLNVDLRNWIERSQREMGSGQDKKASFFWDAGIIPLRVLAYNTGLRWMAIDGGSATLSAMGTETVRTIWFV